MCGRGSLTLDVKFNVCGRGSLTLDVKLDLCAVVQRFAAVGPAVGEAQVPNGEAPGSTALDQGMTGTALNDHTLAHPLYLRCL